MRHELVLENLIFTTDNSAAIGEKEFDEITAPDSLTAKFSGRVALLEQWAAGGEPVAILLHNFSGAKHWDQYVAGIEELFQEAGVPSIPITGSSETNMTTLQSALSVTIIGKKTKDVSYSNLVWFVYGSPLTGEDVLAKPEEIANLKPIHELINAGTIDVVWPVGSKGIAHEMQTMLGKEVSVIDDLDLTRSGGPSTCVIIGVKSENCELLKEQLKNPLSNLNF